MNTATIEIDTRTIRTLVKILGRQKTKQVISILNSGIDRQKEEWAAKSDTAQNYLLQHQQLTRQQEALRGLLFAEIEEASVVDYLMGKESNE